MRISIPGKTDYLPVLMYCKRQLNLDQMWKCTLSWSGLQTSL